MKKLTKKQAKAMAEFRMNKAVVGFQIPMMKIPAIYKQLEAALAEGKSDAELKAIVAGFPGVVASI